MEENSDGISWKDSRTYFVPPEAVRSYAYLERAAAQAETDGALSPAG